MNDKDVEKLKEFARNIIQDYCWNFGDPDGGSIQDLAETLELIEPHIITKKEAELEWEDYEVGDTLFKFTSILGEEK